MCVSDCQFIVLYMQLCTYVHVRNPNGVNMCKYICISYIEYIRIIYTYII